MGKRRKRLAITEEKRGTRHLCHGGPGGYGQFSDGSSYGEDKSLTQQKKTTKTQTSDQLLRVCRNPASLILSQIMLMRTVF